MPSAAEVRRKEVERLIVEDARVQAQRNPDMALREAHRFFQEGKAEQRLAQLHRHRAQKRLWKAKAFKKELEARGITVIFEMGPQHRAMHHQLNATKGGNSDRSQDGA